MRQLNAWTKTCKKMGGERNIPMLPMYVSFATVGKWNPQKNSIGGQEHVSIQFSFNL